MISLRDFSLVESFIKKEMKENNLQDKSDAFYIVILKAILNIQNEEILDSITDNAFILRNKGKRQGHDRGIDAIFINEEDDVIHLFNCKYTEKYEKAKNNNFPSSEIDKILAYIHALMYKDEETIKNSNLMLSSKTKEIWSIFDQKYPKIIIHICSNYDSNLELNERKRLENRINEYSGIEVQYHNIQYFVEKLQKSKRKSVSARFRAFKKEMFEKTDGDIRSLVLNINAYELLRIINLKKENRENTEIEDYEKIIQEGINEEVFYDNVRKYKTTKINNGILKTLSSGNRSRFYYYNNGITILCKNLRVSSMQAPIITLEDFQVVNGNQTLHALSDAARQNINNLEDVELLCRIYEIKDTEVDNKIAEYTNTQNPVTSRDLRAIDSTQEKLEVEFLNEGYYYERKNKMYENEEKSKRIDAEKVGQILMAFYNEMPREAKNSKRLIFGEKYEEVFNENVTVQDILVIHKLYNEIEKRKNEIKKDIIENVELFERKSYILFSTYHILYILGKISKNKEEYTYESLINYYDFAIAIVEKAVETEKKFYKEKYENATFFKSTKPKKYIDEYLAKTKGEYSVNKVKGLRYIKLEV